MTGREIKEEGGSEREGEGKPIDDKKRETQVAPKPSQPLAWSLGASGTQSAHVGVRYGEGGLALVSDLKSLVCAVSAKSYACNLSVWVPGKADLPPTHINHSSAP
jgi:hypothetical protein